MNVPETISHIKEIANEIDLNTLQDNPEAYFRDLVDLISIIKDMDQPMIVNINDLNDRIHKA